MPSEITVRIIGGLGNQMFQYAFARAYALRMNRSLCLDASEFALQDLRAFDLTEFKLSQDVRITHDRTWSQKTKRRAQLLGRFTKVRDNGYFPQMLTRKYVSYFSGYFQSERYFEDAADILRKELTPKIPVELNQHHAPTSHPKVALHIRRGDYVGLDSYGLCTLDYYRNAANAMRNHFGKIDVLVFTDDPQWARGNLEVDQEFTVISDGKMTGFTEMNLMSQCDHFIIANSSFSWWGAWLSANAEKHVICPKPWFDAAHFADVPIVPASWTQMPKQP